MIGTIANNMANSTFVNIAQNTAASVTIESTLKAIGRPSFILVDKNIDAKTKKYAATKEFVYQAMCLAIYLAIIPAVFKVGSFKLGKKIFGKTHPEFYKFSNMGEYLDYHKYASKNIKDRQASLLKTKAMDKFMHNNLRSDLWYMENPPKYDLIKGTIEVGTFIGSILGLSVLAPQISHFAIHPIMKKLNLEDNKKNLDKKA